jgi:hypothetical protein
MSSKEVYVWIWPENEVTPVICGRIEEVCSQIFFDRGSLQFLLTQKGAIEIVKDQIRTIEKKWKAVCEEAELNQVDQNLLWKRQFLNPFTVEGMK